jgi:hypothetical protein
LAVIAGIVLVVYASAHIALYDQSTRLASQGRQAAKHLLGLGGIALFGAITLSAA